MSTRLGIIADVHGNLPALEAVIAAVGPVDGWICAGDIAGHLPQVDEVVHRLRQLNALCVRGNHDEALLKGYAIPTSSAATRALQLQRQYVLPETIKWLAELPETLDLSYDGIRLRVMHGGPGDPLYRKILAVDDELRSNAQDMVLIFGHSHHVLREIKENHALLNPGPVGLPADGQPVAQAMILNLPSRRVEDIAVTYDAEPVISRMRDLGYDERYENCLAGGRWTGFSGAAPKHRIIIVGAAIYGEMIAELVSLLPDHDLVGFVDDSPHVQGKTVCGFPVLGLLSELAKIATEYNVTEVAIGLGDNYLRARIAAIVKQQGVRLARLVHPRASVSNTAKLHPGVIVDAQAYVGPYCELAEGVSIWPGAVVSHHTRVGAYVAMKPGSVIGGHSTIAPGLKIEIGAVHPSYSSLE